MKPVRFLAASMLSLLLSGCLLPEPPKSGSFVDIHETKLFTVYSMDRDHNSAPAVPQGEMPKKMLPTTKNLIFITADNFTGKQFEKQLKAAYRTDDPPSLNEVSWWQFVPFFRDEYHKVIYLPLEQAKYENISAAIQYMEKQSLHYDLIILSHGIPNHLTDGDPGYFLSFKEIDAMKGQLKKLNLVFMQACFGQSLVNDWMEAGAQKVMAFNGFNRNFFFISVFLDHHRWYTDEQAFYTANRDMRKTLTNTRLYKYLIEKGLGMSVDQYMKQGEEPKLTTRATWKPTAETTVTAAATEPAQADAAVPVSAPVDQ